MIYPTFKEEKKLWKKGYRKIACVDEAGRGPLAGPVVACAVAILRFPLAKISFPELVRDSKHLSELQRERVYPFLTHHPAIAWGVGRVGPNGIDALNIFQANQLAMKRAVQALERKLGKRVEFLIVDGNMKMRLPLPQKPIVKADQKVFSCAAASIIAKVRRDRLMRRYHVKYPVYGFDRHKGYGTKLHFATLAQHGPCKIHRKSFFPVKLKFQSLNAK